MLQAYLDERDLSLPVEVETRTLEEVREALGLLQQHPCITRIMLDNMATADPKSEGGSNLHCNKQGPAFEMATGFLFLHC